MQPDQFNHLKIEVASTSAAQILELEDFIGRVVAEQFVEMALARRTKAVTETRICPRCNKNNVVRHGKDQNNRQRFKCRGCRRTYNILTGTPMARARKPEKWASYLNFMTQHNAVRAIRAAGIGLSHVTVWRWRHRFLQAAANDNSSVLCGVIEVDTTFFRHSFKGRRGGFKAIPPEAGATRSRAGYGTKKGRLAKQVPVLTALDSSGGIFQAILPSLSDIETIIAGRIAAGSVLCFEDCADYARVADSLKAEPWVISGATTNPGAVGRNPPASPCRGNGHLGLRRVHAHHQQLRHLVNDRCRGVATRYLGNYLGWHRAMVRPRFEGKALLTRALA